MAALGLCALLAGISPVRAQSTDDIARSALLERQQQSDAFTQQLRQSQQRVNTLPAQRPELDMRQLRERQDMDDTNARQAEALRGQQTMAGAPGDRPAFWGPRLDAEPQRMQRERDTLIDRASRRN